jgi:hypothetical protein
MSPHRLLKLDLRKLSIKNGGVYMADKIRWERVHHKFYLGYVGHELVFTSRKRFIRWEVIHWHDYSWIKSRKVFTLRAAKKAAERMLNG